MRVLLLVHFWRLLSVSMPPKYQWLLYPTSERLMCLSLRRDCSILTGLEQFRAEDLKREIGVNKIYIASFYLVSCNNVWAKRYRPLYDSLLNALQQVAQNRQVDSEYTKVGATIRVYLGRWSYGFIVVKDILVTPMTRICCKTMRCFQSLQFEKFCLCDELHESIHD